MQMTVHNLDRLKVIDYRQCAPLQGQLKDLSDTNAEKLKQAILKHGFTVPLKLWFDDSTGLPYLLDSHQTQRVMMMNDMNDGGSYDVPYVRIPGKDIKEAKEQLLEIASQYGHATVDGLDEYLAAAELDLEDLHISFEGIDLDKFVDDLADIEDDETEPDEKPKSKKYTTEQLKKMALDKWPKQPVIVEFLNWVDDADS